MFKGKEENMPRDLCGTSGNSSVAVPSRSMKESIERLQGWFRWQLVGLRQLHVVCVQRPVIGLSAVATSGLCHSVEKNIKERIGEEEQACSALGAPLKGRIAFSTLSCRRPPLPSCFIAEFLGCAKKAIFAHGAAFRPLWSNVSHCRTHHQHSAPLSVPQQKCALLLFAAKSLHALYNFFDLGIFGVRWSRTVP